MSHVRKKTRATTGDSKSLVSTTQTGQTLDNLLVWLKQFGTKGLDTGGLEFRICEEDDGCGLGGFAQKDFAVGEVVFAVPLVCLISVTSAYDTAVTKLVRDAAIAFEDPSLVTSELLIWLFMIDQLADPASHYYPYLRSLDSQSPSPLSWPAELKAALVGTNISTMETSLSSLNRHAQFLDSVRQWAVLTNRACAFMDANHFNLTSLLWARGHYLARRYPAKFSSESYSESDDLKNRNQGDGREEGMMNLGALVPLLDILNHNPEQEWLTFKVVNGYLNVTCNYPIAKGSEIFSNYGSLSNEMLLFAYGFSLEGNADDAITLQLMGSNQSAGSSSSVAPSQSTAAAAAASASASAAAAAAAATVKHYGTYYIREGGMSGVPNELWKQLTSLLGDDTVDVPEEEEQQIEGNEEDAEDGSDNGSAVEIGVEECCMLKDCLQRKLDSLMGTEESASAVLDSSTDPRAQYIKWYRAGQVRIAEEALHALNAAILEQDQYDEEGSVE